MALKIKDIMTKNVKCVHPQMTLGEVGDLFSKKKVSGFPVIDREDEKLIGIISRADLLNNNGNGQDTKVRNAMIKKVYSIPEYGDISTAARIMRNHKIHRLVVTKDKKVVGIVSSYDLLRLLEDRAFVPKNKPSKNKHKKEKL